jgi:hypothetical protein
MIVSPLTAGTSIFGDHRARMTRVVIEVAFIVCELEFENIGSRFRNVSACVLHPRDTGPIGHIAVNGYLACGFGENREGGNS